MSGNPDAGDLAALRELVATALVPANGAEAAVLIDAVDLFVDYCSRFSSQRDRRFSMLDQTPIDETGCAAACEIRDRVLRAIGHRQAVAWDERRTIISGLRAKLRVPASSFDTSDVAAPRGPSDPPEAA